MGSWFQYTGEHSEKVFPTRGLASGRGGGLSAREESKGLVGRCQKRAQELYPHSIPFPFYPIPINTLKLAHEPPHTPIYKYVHALSHIFNLILFLSRLFIFFLSDSHSF